jgi:hypothetical protein
MALQQPKLRMLPRTFIATHLGEGLPSTVHMPKGQYLRTLRPVGKIPLVGARRVSCNYHVSAFKPVPMPNLAHHLKCLFPIRFSVYRWSNFKLSVCLRAPFRAIGICHTFPHFLFPLHSSKHLFCLSHPGWFVKRVLVRRKSAIKSSVHRSRALHSIHFHGEPDLSPFSKNSRFFPPALVCGSTI